MPIQVPHPNQSESAADLALTLSDLLYSQGERTRARAVLELFESGDRDERLTTRLADDALEQGDAPRALKLLARIWEGGSLNPYVEARLALAALAVGLTEVVEALTEAPSRSTEHAIVRLIHAAQRGEQFSVAGVASATETVFAIRSHLRILAVCGRHDLVEAVAQAHLDLPGIQTALHGLPREAAPSHELIKVDIDAARETFTKHWRGPGGLAASNWAWAVAREIGVGEHVLLLSPWPDALRGLLAHAHVTAVSMTGGPGVDVIAEPERLPFAPARFQHVVAADWLGAALNPEAALQSMAGALMHDGQLHVLCAGPAGAGEQGMTFAPRTLVRLAERVGLLEPHALARQASGLPAQGADAEITLLRAMRRVV
jgi:hypothetical protein